MLEASRKEIAYRENTVSKEDLPFPLVYYPGHYGTFFGFKQDEKGTLFFCACAREAIENYIKLQLLVEWPDWIDPKTQFIIKPGAFPKVFRDHLININAPNDETVIEYMKFRKNLCHECNGVVPTYCYCDKMYGASFKQNYGWYINKQALEYGFDGWINKLPERCPGEILELITISPDEYASHYNELKKKWNEQQNKICNLIENEVRQKFGHKKVGESWTNETILYYIVKKIYSAKTILRHYRPDYLQGLEFDIFIKEFNLAIEYQGIQHFQPVEHWGGEEALNRQIDRDKKKKEICEKEGIPLLYFRYDDGLNDEIVLSRIQELIQTY